MQHYHYHYFLACTEHAFATNLNCDDSTPCSHYRLEYICNGNCSCKNSCPLSSPNNRTNFCSHLGHLQRISLVKVFQPTLYWTVCVQSSPYVRLPSLFQLLDKFPNGDIRFRNLGTVVSLSPTYPV